MDLKNFTQSILHPHWVKFIENGQLPASHWVHVSTGLYMLLVGIVGAVGNWYLFWKFIGCKLLRSPSNTLVANLALSNFGISFIQLIFTMPSAFAEHWLFGETGCIFYAAAVGLCGVASIGSLTAIAVDRSCSIIRWGTWQLSYFRASMMILIVWIFSLTMVIPPVFGWSAYILESVQTSCTWDYLTLTPENIYFNLYIFLVGFILPLTIIVFCYASIIVHIFRHRNLLRLLHMNDTNLVGRQTLSHAAEIDIPKHGTFQRNQAMLALHIRSTVACLIIVCLFCIAWTPYAIVALIGTFGDQTLLTPFVTFIPVLLAKSSSIYNPIVYVFTNAKFRDAVKGHSSPRMSQRAAIPHVDHSVQTELRDASLLIPLYRIYSASSDVSTSSSINLNADKVQRSSFNNIEGQCRNRDRSSVEFVKVPRGILTADQILILEQAHILPGLSIKGQ